MTEMSATTYRTASASKHLLLPCKKTPFASLPVSPICKPDIDGLLSVQNTLNRRLRFAASTKVASTTRDREMVRRVCKATRGQAGNAGIRHQGWMVEAAVRSGRFQVCRARR